VGKKALLQRATKNEFNVMWRPAGPFTDVDVSVNFNRLSGKKDASGRRRVRFTDGKYYVVRANALGGQFPAVLLRPRPRQLDERQRQPRARPVALLGIAVRDHSPAGLDGALLIDHRDSRFK